VVLLDFLLQNFFDSRSWILSESAYDN